MVRLRRELQRREKAIALLVHDDDDGDDDDGDDDDDDDDDDDQPSAEAEAAWCRSTRLYVEEENLPSPDIIAIVNIFYLIFFIGNCEYIFIVIITGKYLASDNPRLPL